MSWPGRTPEGGYDPESQRAEITPLAPGLSLIRLPWQPIRVVHALDVRDTSEPSYTDGKLIAPQDADCINAECPDCDSELAVIPCQEPGITWFAVEHRPTCPAFRALIARSRP